MSRPDAPPAYPELSSVVPQAPAATLVPEAAQDLPREARAGVTTALLVALIGGPVGLLWAAVRPHLDYGAAALQESVFTLQLGADLRLLAIGVAVGAVVGLLAWLLTRTSITGVAVGLAVGGVLAMMLAAAVGRLAAHPDRLTVEVAQAFRARGYIELSQVEEPGRSTFLSNVRFAQRARSVDLGLPVAACGVFSLLVWRRDRSSRGDPAPPRVALPDGAPPYPPYPPCAPHPPPGVSPGGTGALSSG